MKLKRFSVATPSSSARMIALLRIQRAPAISPPVSCDAPGGSSTCIRPRKSADQKYETASTASAYGPRKSATSDPPIALPTMYENARLPCTSEFACTYSVRGTIIWIIAPYATKKKTVSTPLRNATM